MLCTIRCANTQWMNIGEWLKAFLFVDSRRRLVEHHHRVSTSQWQHYIFTNDTDIVELSSIEVSFTLKEIYAKVYLELEEE